MNTSASDLDPEADIDARRSRVVRMIAFFSDLHSAAKALGLRTTTLARATSDSHIDMRALREVEEVVDRMQADFDRVEVATPKGRPMHITLPDGICVTGIVSRLVPRDGAPWAEIDVLGPNLFDVERSGLYIADGLRFSPLDTAASRDVAL